MAKDMTPEALAGKTFWVTILGCVAFFLAVLLFVL